MGADNQPLIRGTFSHEKTIEALEDKEILFHAKHVVGVFSSANARRS
jgi:hypothetical protein